MIRCDMRRWQIRLQSISAYKTEIPIGDTHFDLICKWYPALVLKMSSEIQMYHIIGSSLLLITIFKIVWFWNQSARFVVMIQLFLIVYKYSNLENGKLWKHQLDKRVPLVYARLPNFCLQQLKSRFSVTCSLLHNR